MQAGLAETVGKMRYIALVLGAVLYAGTAEASCPAPLAGARPGWFVEAYPRDQSTRPDQAAMPTALAAGTLNVPFNLIQLHMMTTKFEQYVLFSRVKICNDGDYDFYIYIQRGAFQGGRGNNVGIRRSLLCETAIRVNGVRIAGLRQRVSYDGMTVTAGKISLPAGWAELRLSLGCSGASFDSMSYPVDRDASASAVFTARIRGPEDATPRDFRVGEVVQLGRATSSIEGKLGGMPATGQGATRSQTAPAPQNATPNPVPEQVNPASRQTPNINIR